MSLIGPSIVTTSSAYFLPCSTSASRSFLTALRFGNHRSWSAAAPYLAFTEGHAQDVSHSTCASYRADPLRTLCLHVLAVLQAFANEYPLTHLPTMALTNLFTHIFNKLSLFPRLFQPTTDALFSNLPINYRWRLLLLQPINILCFLLTAPSFLFSTSYTVIYIPTRSGPKRCLVFQPARRKPDASRPLHIDFHGGGFIGGFPEQGARWCKLLAEETGAVVVSGSY